MVSRSARVGQAFGSKGVLNNAAKAEVEAVGGGGVEEASNDSAALGTGNPGALKFATNRKTLHMYDGTEWDRIAGGTDAAPVITEDAPVVGVPALATDSQRVKFKVTDPEGFPISYSISYMRDSDKVFFGNESSNMPPFLAHPAIITKADSGRATYRFITRTTESDGNGNSTKDLYKARYFGTDGARHAVSTKDFQLQFSVGVNFDISLSGWNDMSGEGNGTNTDQYSFAGGTSTYPYSSRLASGRKYMEMKFTTSIGNYPMIGLGDDGHTGRIYHYNNNDSRYLYFNNTIYPGGGSPGITSANWVSGTVIGLAWDTNTGDVWFSRENSWGSRDPNDSNTGVGGVDWYSWGPLTNYVSNGKVGICFVCTNGSSGGSWKGIIQRGDSLKYTPPTGFTSQ